MKQIILSLFVLLSFNFIALAQGFAPPQLPDPISASFIGSPSFSNAGCIQQQNPHTFECHDMTFIGQSEFPLVSLNSIQGEWFAVTYAVRGSNQGAGFVMDKNQVRPTQPGRGVFNLSSGDSSLMGSLFINGNRATFGNWQGAPMTSSPGTYVFLDHGTVQFNTVDHIGVQHSFQCRDFIRRGNHHLNCRWLILRQGQWDFIGYFGFLTRQAWDQFVIQSRQRR